MTRHKQPKREEHHEVGSVEKSDPGEENPAQSTPRDEARDRQPLLQAGAVTEEEGKLIVTPLGEALLLKALEARSSAREIPQWDGQAQTLLWRGEAIKHLKREAEVQQIVLDEFERQGWQEWIENPLQDDAWNDDPRQHLRDTVSSLNDRLQANTIRFHAERGGIRWEAL